MSNEMGRFAVYGSGGFGREVLPMLRETQGATDIVFVDDDEKLWGSLVNGVKVISREQALADNRSFLIAIGSPSIRHKIWSELASRGANFATLRAPTMRSYDDVSIGDGGILCDYVVASSNIRIGKQFHANFHCYIAHDCVIGDFVTLAPHVSCGGRLEIGDQAYIGMGAVIKQGVPGKPLRIGAGAVIGMGAVVTKDVPDGATVVGNPARILDKKA